MIDDPCRMPRKREQPRHINAKLRQIGDRKRHPAERNNKQYIKMTDHPAFIQQAQQKELFYQQAAKQNPAPDQEVIIRPVPQRGKAPHHKQIEKGARLSLPVASQRNVYIFPEPSAERNMPSAPEFRD